MRTIEEAAAELRCAAPTDSERITSLQGQVNELRSLVHKLEETHYFGEERLRQDRWHATYNTALGRVGDDSPENMRECIDFCHRTAAAQADRAHGPLEQKP